MSAIKEVYLNNLPFTDGFEECASPKNVISQSRKRYITKKEFKKLRLKDLTYK